MYMPLSICIKLFLVIGTSSVIPSMCEFLPRLHELTREKGIRTKHAPESYHMHRNDMTAVPKIIQTTGLSHTTSSMLCGEQKKRRAFPSSMELTLNSNPTQKTVDFQLCSKTRFERCLTYCESITIAMLQSYDPLCMYMQVIHILPTQTPVRRSIHIVSCIRIDSSDQIARYLPDRC